MDTNDDIFGLIRSLKTEGTAFAIATVVRTVSLTAAKAGAKAVIGADGAIQSGWIGGGCARGAVLRAAKAAIADGRPRLISVQPPDILAAQGVRPGESREGTEFAKNLCPSQGTMDIFVEPVLPRPELLVCGASPIAVALAALAPLFGYAVRIAVPAADQAAFARPAADQASFAEPDMGVTAYDFTSLAPAERYIAIATQGKGDEAALCAALAVPARYRGFVGSRRKIAALTEALINSGADRTSLAVLHAPAGLAIGAVTPEEIALSILAEITAIRRQGVHSAAAAWSSE